MKLAQKLYLQYPLLTLLGVNLFQMTFVPPMGWLLLFDKIVLYYWLVKRPDRVSLFFLSFFYLLFDIKDGWVLGYSSLLMLTFSWAVLLQRHVLFKRTFIIKWAYYSFILLVYVALVYAIHRYFYQAHLSVGLYVVSFIMASLSYPVVAALLNNVSPYVPYTTDIGN